MSINQINLVKKIEEVAAAERVTKQLLSELSRELLEYVPDTNDVGMVNRLLLVLTPMNKTTATLFFKEFLPWNMDDTGSVFLGKDKSAKRVDKKMKAIAEFLADKSNNIWTWAEQNVSVEKKPADLSGGIVAAIERAKTGAKETSKTEETPPISTMEILSAVMAGGVSITEIIEFAETNAPLEQESAA